VKSKLTPHRPSARLLRTRVALLSSLSCLLGVTSSWAQSPDKNSESPVSTSSDESKKTEAAAHFSQGVAYLQDPTGSRSLEARGEFLRAYELSGNWKILGNLGLAAMELERDGEAIEAFRQYLLKGGPEISEAERKVVQDDLRTLEAGVGWVTLRLSGENVTVTDVRRSSMGTVSNEYSSAQSLQRLGLRSGSHQLTLLSENGERRVWDFQLSSGEKIEKEFEFSRAPSKKLTPAPASAPADQGGHRPMPTSVYVGLATTGLFAAGAATMGVLTLNKKGKYDDLNDGSQSTAAEDLNSQIKTYGLVTDILIGASAVSAGVTAILYFTRPTVQVSQARIQWTPLVGPNLAALQLSGAF